MKLLPLKRTMKQPPTRQGDSSPADSHSGINRGMEFAVMVLLFFGIGYGLDHWFGTKPVFMIVFVVLAIVGQFASLYYNYDVRMKALEERRAEGAQRGRTKLG
jgi:F0F1-type ATP synthase assembly protein I